MARPHLLSRALRSALILAAAAIAPLAVGWKAVAQTAPAGKAAAKPRTAAAAAGTGAGGAGGGSADAPKVKVERGAGGKKIYRITEDIRIEGKIQKPEAFFFYQKSSINYDWQELKKDFLPNILDSVNHSPF